MDSPSKGLDPALEKKKEKDKSINASTINGLINEYLEVWSKPRKRSWREDERILNKDVKPKWGKRKTHEITKRDVVLLLENITKRGAPIAANRTLACIRRMFNFGVERDLVSTNPCTSIKAPAKENRRERSLSADEIHHFWHVISRMENKEKTPRIKMSDATKLALKLMLVTAQRKGEVISAEWSEFDLINHVWTIPSEKAKNSKTHRVPLSALAVELLTEIKERINHSRWLFPANHTVKEDTHMTGSAIDHALRRSLDALENVGHFSPHSLRATATTHMASMRISGEIISKILNHAKKGVTEQHYNKYEYEEEKRNALDAWSHRLKDIITGENSNNNIVPLKKVI
jgi:integrase